MLQLLPNAIAVHGRLASCHHVPHYPPPLPPTTNDRTRSTIPTLAAETALNKAIRVVAVVCLPALDYPTRNILSSAAYAPFSPRLGFSLATPPPASFLPSAPPPPCSPPAPRPTPSSASPPTIYRTSAPSKINLARYYNRRGQTEILSLLHY